MMPNLYHQMDFGNENALDTCVSLFLEIGNFVKKIQSCHKLTGYGNQFLICATVLIKRILGHIRLHQMGKQLIITLTIYILSKYLNIMYFKNLENLN